jgi:hypothetical protein
LTSQSFAGAPIWKSWAGDVPELAGDPNKVDETHQEEEHEEAQTGMLVDNSSLKKSDASSRLSTQTRAAKPFADLVHLSSRDGIFYFILANIMLILVFSFAVFVVEQLQQTEMGFIPNVTFVYCTSIFLFLSGLLQLCLLLFGYLTLARKDIWLMLLAISTIIEKQVFKSLEYYVPTFGCRVQ